VIPEHEEDCNLYPVVQSVQVFASLHFEHPPGQATTHNPDLPDLQYSNPDWFQFEFRT